jgi:3-methyladenine DNA glycosylase AlkD
MVDPAASLAERIDADLRALADHSVATVRKRRRHWSAQVRREPAATVFAVALDLVERFHHRWVAYELLLSHPSALELVDPANVERFAGRLGSWGEVDQFGTLLAGPAWRAGRIDDRTVHAWAARPDRWWRRAALVATVPLNTRSQGGRGDTARTLGVCELLAQDRDEMVAKALSWALRALIGHDRLAVQAFLAAHDAALSARVKREVGNKLATGLKNPPSSWRAGPARP